MQALPANRPSNVLQFPPSVLPAPVAAKQPPAPSDMVLHDARNALASLYLLSGLLREPGVVSPSHAQYIDDLDHVTGLLAGLLCAGQGAPEVLQAATATAAVRRCQQLLQAAAGAAVAVHVSAENGLPALRMDDEALSRVLLNLVKNAAEAMDGAGTIHITARRGLSRKEPAVLIHVTDNGPGIAAHALPHIFEPGWSSKTGRTRGEKCGLGLSIVRDLVRDAGGTVQVASTRRRGTTFELHLPCAAR